MARQEKLSRYRGLNPYVQKQKKENIAWYSISASFDDNKTQSFFISTSLERINYPTTFNISSSYLISEISTSLTTYGRTVPQNVNQYIQQQDDQLPTVTPFVDITDYANDGFIVAASESFFRTGSLIENAGFGFQQPLREKTKIEIDMPLASTQILGSSITSDYLMGYYNFTTRTVDTIGGSETPYDIYSGSTTFDYYIADKAIGFAPSIVDYKINRASYNGEDIYKNQAIPIKTFGFPSDSRYKVAKNSGILFSLSASIKEPFLLEKAILHIGNLELLIDSNFNLTNDTSAVLNFFILNQRENNPHVENYVYEIAERFKPYTNYPATINKTNYIHSTIATQKDIKLDLITYAKIGTANSNAISSVFPYLDLALTNTIGSGMGFTVADTNVNLNINQATKNTETINFFPVLEDSTALVVMKLKGLNGSRSGVDQISDRNWNRGVAGDPQLKSLEYKNDTKYSSFAFYSDNNTLTIPYILLPTDNLIFGWQAPLLDQIHFIADTNFIASSVNFWKNTGASSQVILSGKFKLTLYGSYLRMNDQLEYEEYHEYDMNDKSLNNVSTVVIGEPIYKGDKL